MVGNQLRVVSLNNVEQMGYKYLEFALMEKTIAISRGKMKKGINCLD